MQQVSVLEWNALGLARGTRRVQQCSDIVGAGALDESIAQGRFGCQALTAFGKQGLKGSETGRVLEAAWVVEDDEVKRAVVFFAYQQEFVDLFLVFCNGKPDVLALDLAGEFFGLRIGIGRRGDGAQRNGCQHAEIQRRAVVSNDENNVFGTHTAGFQCGRQGQHGIQVLLPGVFLPDAVIPFAHGNLVGVRPGVGCQNGKQMVVVLPVWVQAHGFGFQGVGGCGASLCSIQRPGRCGRCGNLYSHYFSTLPMSAATTSGSLMASWGSPSLIFSPSLRMTRRSQLAVTTSMWGAMGRMLSPRASWASRMKRTMYSFSS